MERKLIIGCGAGRTGTSSLAYLLNMQPDAHVTHERATHKFHWGKPERWFNKLHAEWQQDPGGLHGDVALQWGSSLRYVLNRGARVVVFKRDLEPWLVSWKHKSGPRNNWQPEGEGGTPRANWWPCFPKFNGASSKKEALTRYWEMYYNHIVPDAQADWPEDVGLFYVECLNTEAGQRRLLDFCQVPTGAQVIKPGLRRNKGRQRRRKPK